MIINRRKLLAAAMGASVLAGMTPRQGQAQVKGNYRTLQWEDLLPDGWNPRAAMAGIDTRSIAEGSAQEMEMLRKMRKIWDNAPVRPDLDGQQIRLAGYVVPLELSSGAIREFLLVPYFGACIHSPPPPANQIVMVKLQKAIRIRTMDACWVAGIMNTQHNNTDWGVSGYFLAGHHIDEYRGPRKP